MHDIAVAGVDYRSAPIAMRERLSSVASADGLRQLASTGGLPELMILSTCNRYEVIGASHGDAGQRVEAVFAEVAGRSRVSKTELRNVMFRKQRTVAVRHLFGVVAGHESMLYGETQIVSQFRRAKSLAHTAGTLGPVLDRLASCALGASRRARSITSSRVTVSPRSMGSAAVDTVRALLTENVRVAIVGAGDVADNIMTALRRNGVRGRQITILNRTPARAATLAERHCSRVAEWSQLDRVIGSSRLIFCCTSAPNAVIDRTCFATRVHSHAATLVDLGVPRNVDSSVALLPNVRVIDVDHLAVGCESPVISCDHAASRELDAHARQFDAWLRRRTIVPTLKTIQSSTEALREDEFARLRGVLGDLDERRLEAIEVMSKRLVNRLLHRPLSTLAAHPESQELVRVARLFFDSGREVECAS